MQLLIFSITSFLLGTLFLILMLRQMKKKIKRMMPNLVTPVRLMFIAWLVTGLLINLGSYLLILYFHQCGN